MMHQLSLSTAKKRLKASVKTYQNISVFLLSFVLVLALFELVQVNKGGLINIVLHFAPDLAVTGHVLWLTDWLLMCAVMMLPTTLPLLVAFQRTTDRHQSSTKLILVCVLGFLGVWLLLGMVWRMLSIQLFLYFQAYDLPYKYLFAGMSILAGLYLVSGLATNCVRACRSPIGFIAQHWSGRPDVSMQSFRIGSHYGLSCIGCCWPLMVIMGLLGMTSPIWMLVMTLLMFIQKTVEHGALMMRIFGILFVIYGIAILINTVKMPVPTVLDINFMNVCFTR